MEKLKSKKVHVSFFSLCRHFVNFGFFVVNFAQKGVVIIRVHLLNSETSLHIFSS